MSPTSKLLSLLYLKSLFPPFYADFSHISNRGQTPFLDSVCLATLQKNRSSHFLAPTYFFFFFPLRCVFYLRTLAVWGSGLAAKGRAFLPFYRAVLSPSRGLPPFLFCPRLRKLSVEAQSPQLRRVLFSTRKTSDRFCTSCQGFLFNFPPCPRPSAQVPSNPTGPTVTPFLHLRLTQSFFVSLFRKDLRPRFRPLYLPTRATLSYLRPRKNFTGGLPPHPPGTSRG